MRKYKPVPVKVAMDIAKGFDKSIVVINAWDPVYGLLHTTTFGVEERDKQWAAQAGEITAVALGAGLDKAKYYENFRKNKEVINNDKRRKSPNEKRA